MSTNGQITFVAAGHVKRSYNHSDSYPEWFGVRVLGWLREAVKDETALREAIGRLTVVCDGDTPAPTDAQRKALANVTDDRGGGPDEHWYRLTRMTQGDPGAILACGYAYDQNYGIEEDEHLNYIVDTNRRQFRILGHSWSFDQLPTDAQFLAAFGD